MPKVRMSHDGWLALPATVRRRLGLATGAELDVELAGGAIILRPAHEAGAIAAPSAEEALLPIAPRVEAAPPEPVAAPPSSPSAKAKPGRSRKIPTADGHVALPAKPKARGRRAGAPTTEEPT